MGTLVDLYMVFLSADMCRVFGREPDIFLLKFDQLVVMEAGLLMAVVVVEVELVASAAVKYIYIYFANMKH